MSTPGDVTKRPLPPGWRWVKLGEVCEVEKGRTPQEQWYAASGVRLIRFRDIKNGTIDWSAGFRSHVAAKFSRLLKPLLPETTLITSDAHDPTSIGKKLAFVKDIPASLGSVFYSGEMIGIRPLDKGVILPEWPYFWFSSAWGYAVIQKHIEGVHLNVGNARQMQIPLPPLSEQRRIVAILREQMAAVERARRAAEEQLEAAKALPAAFLRQVFPRPGQPLPPGWRWVKLGEVCEIRMGETLIEKDLTGEGIPVYSANTSDKPWGFTSRCRLRFGQNSVVIGARGSIGFPRWPNIREWTATQTTIVLTSRNIQILDPQWLLRVLQHIDFKTVSAQQAIPMITVRAIEILEIPLPPLSEQQRIAAILREQMAAAEKVRKAIEAQLEAINKLPAAILRKAFSGEL